MSIEQSKSFVSLVFRKHLQDFMRCLHGYDVPLQTGSDSTFLVILIALMSFLAILSCTGSFALHGMTQRWSSGLENKVTIEIDAQMPNGDLLSRESMKIETDNLAQMLRQSPVVKSFDVLDEKEISALVSPWLGNDLILDDIPLPGIIAIELNVSDPSALEKLENSIRKISKSAVLDTHRDWLKDILRFAHALEFIAICIALIIGAITITAISSGVLSRMAIHKEELEILHLIGATDDYIARQFQRHAAFLAFKGSCLGTFIGLMVTIVVVFLASNSQNPLIPQLALSGQEIFILLLLPLIVTLIALLAARYTVLRTLAKMP